jgi:anti-sigma factor RsiW
MDCTKAREMIQDHIDGRLPPDEAGVVRGHLGACRACGAEEEELRRVGDMLRLWSAVRVEEREPQLSAMWTRVNAEIGGRRKAPVVLLRRWFWVPAAAILAVVTFLVYPFNGSKVPFHPKSFDVTVESLESDTATVALVDKGKGLPRVIWIIENGKT